VLENGDELEVGSGEVTASLTQPREVEHFGTHSSVSLIFCQKVGPVEFSERSFYEIGADQCSVWLQTPDILPEKILLVVGVVRLQ
jgi:hypothetical protein